jgi:hypothetical protein
MTINSSGNVGIGTTSPGSMLDVAGGVRAGSSTAVTSCGMGQANGEGTQRYNYTNHTLEYCNGTAWIQPAGASNFSNITTQTFTSSGTFTVPSGVRLLKVLVVGGGGAGSYAANQGVSGGGGGGGQAVSALIPTSPGTVYNVTVGNGGVESTSNGAPGQNSSFGSLTALGGAGGTAPPSPSGQGGNGGGATNGGAYGATGGSVSAPSPLMHELYIAISGGGGGGSGAAGGSTPFASGGTGSGGGGASYGAGANGTPSWCGWGNDGAPNSGAGGSGAGPGCYGNSGGSGGSGLVQVTYWQ